MRPTLESAFTAIQASIRATGAKATTSRVRVLRLLQSARNPMCHGEIEEALLKEAFPPIDRVTLYRVLDCLVDIGLAHRATDQRGVFRFSAATPDVEHAAHLHFRCTACGGVFCLDSPLPPPPVLPDGFRLAALEMDLRGECAECAGSRS